MASKQLIPYLIGAAAGAVLAVALGHVLPCPVPLKRNAKGVYVLAVHFKLVPGTLDAFKARFAVLAEHCRKYERDTLSYELCLAEGDPHTVLIYERYTNKSDLDDIHRQSPIFKAFGKWLWEESGAELLKNGLKSIVSDQCAALVHFFLSFLTPLYLPPTPPGC
jgi:quinol monooxygenase YgiN